MKPIIAALVAALACGGCGVADTGSATVAIAAAKKKELEQARATQERLQQEINASMQAREDQLKKMEESAR